MPWKNAADAGVYLRRGQVSMLVAAPGFGKSVIANAFVVQSGALCLYCSMDTDAYTASIRLIASESGSTIEQAEALRASQPEEAAAVVSEIDSAYWAFPSSPDEREIGERLLAFREVEGSYPELLVLDNLSNISFDDEEFAGLRRVMRELQSVAMRTGTSILVLHHATGEYEDGGKPIPLSGINGKLSKYPSLILTGYGRGSFSVVKNRFGPADPSGMGVQFHLDVDLERMQVCDDAVKWRGARGPEQ